MGYAKYEKYNPTGLEEIKSNWDLKFFSEFHTKYKHLQKFLYHGSYLPEERYVFNAYKIFPKDVKFVLMAQSPCPIPNYSNGLALSVKKEIPYERLTSASRVVLREYERAYNILPDHGDLSKLKDLGGFLPNLYCTCAPFYPDKHLCMGWEDLATEACQFLAEKKTGLLFLFCGYRSWRIGEEIKHIAEKHDHKILYLSQPTRRGVVSEKSLNFRGSNVFRIISQHTGLDLSQVF